MQENTEQPTSLSQFLRENYLAEAHTQQRHSEMSRFDSSWRLVYGPLKGKEEDSAGQDEPQAQFPDLSAFLSQEELDKSVNLACQAIGREAREERPEAEAAVAPSTSSDTQLDLKLKELLQTHPTFLPERLPQLLSTHDSAIKTDESVHQTSQRSVQDNALRADGQTCPLSTIQDGAMKTSGVARESLEDHKKPGAGGKNMPAYGLETQSKKEFLNKAADFIEELSSLFKANSSKRIRPRSCKGHRSRANKGQADGGVYPLNTDDRERPVNLQNFEMEVLRADNPFSNQPPEVMGLTMEPALKHADLPTEDCRTNDPQYDDSGVLEADEGNEAESPVLVEVSPGVYTANPICEPPHFIQKLKSREVPEGSKVQLDCIVQGLPMPDVRWFCEGKELENCPDIQIINNGELHSLIIAEAFEEDTGRYSCFASNFYGTDSTSAEIYIEGASSTDSDGDQHFEHVVQHKRTQSQPGVPSLPLAVSAASVFEEDTPAYTEEHPQEAASLTSPPSSQAASVPAQVESSATPPVPVVPTQGPGLGETLPVQGVSTSSLSTPSPVSGTATPLQTQTVSATALPPTHFSSTLPAQVAAVQTSLAENLNGDSNTLRPDVYPQGLDGRPLMAAPVFTKSLQDLLASESQLVVLECRVKGVPSPKVDWYREGTLIEDSPDFRILQKKPRSMGETEEICTLVIAEVFPEDSGTFTCTASNKYGTVSSIAKLRVKGNDNTIRSNTKTLRGTLTMEHSSSKLSPPSLPSVTNSVKPHSNTIRLDPLSSSMLRLDPLSTSTLRLDPLSSGMLRQDTVSTSMPSLGPLSLGSSPRIGTRSSSTSRLDPLYLSTPHLDVATTSSGLLTPEVQSRGENHLTVQEDSSTVSLLPDLGLGQKPKVKGTQNPEKPPPVNLPDPPISSCLKPGVLVNQNGPRSGSKAGLRVHFKLPEDETDNDSEAHSSMSYEEMSLLANKGPPPVLAKPKLDPVQLQLLHNQVLLEQQQIEPTGTTQCQQTHQAQQSLPRSSTPMPLQNTNPLPSLNTVPTPLLNSTPRLRTNTTPAPLHSTASAPLLNPYTIHSYSPLPSSPLFNTNAEPPLNTTSAPPQNTTCAPVQNTTCAPVQNTTSAPIQNTTSAPPLNSTYALLRNTTCAPLLNTTLALPQNYTNAPLQNTTSASIQNTSSALLMTTTSVPVVGTVPSPAASYMTSPSVPRLSTGPSPHLYTSPASPPYMTQQNTTHSSQPSLAPSSLPKPVHAPHQFSSPNSPRPNTAPFISIPAAFGRPFTTVQNTTLSSLLQTTHSSLLDMSPTSQSFNYARPKEFIPARTPLSPVMSPSPTESPVPLLQELAAELHSSSPNLFSPQPRFFPTRVLKSPTSPPSFMSSPTSPTLLPAAYLNSVFTLPQQSPPQAASPTSSTSSPIQDHVAFLSSVLPSLHPTQATNSMGLPKSTHGPPQGSLKKLPPSPRPISDDELRSSQQNLLQDIEKKLQLNDNFMRGIQQKLTTNEGKTASRALGPNIPATVFNYDEEYKVSNFEQRLMSEIEFRLERTPVEESDDEVHHDEIPTGKCIAPIFDKKLKNFRAMEGVPMTFSCKVVGIPIPKVYWFKDGKQILRKNDHYKKIREGDGTCALHIEVTNSDDDGNYTVMAANPQGRISCSGHLIIQTAPLRNRTTNMIRSQRVRARIQEVEEGEPTQERFFRPHFLQAPGDMVAHEGKVCRLDCKVSGLPNPEMMWLINGRPIYPDYYHRMLVRENGIHSLLIDPLKQGDAGTYTCIASNKAGQSSFSLELKVVEKEMKQAPHFVEKLQNTGIAEGTPVRLECRVLGMPPPLIYWKKDNDTIPHTKDRVSLHQDATGYVCLLIQPTRKEDAGWYTVSAKNEAGIISCTARLDIYAQWHQHVPLPLKKTPRQGSRYAALTGQGLDIKYAFPTTDNSPILFSSSPVEAHLESDEL
ncbi:myopalladin isoform X1 [Esox lucius]|uniref:Myopalladin n=1 Tax=Esox lucius TaxID=8010 RepID=A0A3P9AHE9_ESOLU|nr:myopalladin isoform X1 [Esox lucius]